MTQCPVCFTPLTHNESVCPSCGYRMAGATQAFEPVVINPLTAVSQQPVPNLAQVKVVKGPQAGNTIELRGDRLTIGRSPQCDVFLNDMTVSRLHAVLERTGATYTVLDQDSYNGLWVNNVNVKSAMLADGDVVQVGTFSLVFQSCAR